MVRKLAIVWGVLFALVAASGWVPQWITETHMTPSGPERTMWGLFMLSLLDDITHGMTAVALFLGAIVSHRAARLAFTAFGWYYACDALFFLTFGLFNEKPYVADIALNLPHVVISAIMLWIAYKVAPREDAGKIPARAAVA